MKNVSAEAAAAAVALGWFQVEQIIYRRILLIGERFWGAFG